MNTQQIIIEIIRVIEKGRFLLFSMPAGFLGWLGSLPQLWGLLGEIRELIAQIVHGIDTLKKVPEMRDAIALARDKGDTSALEKLFGKPQVAASAQPKP